MNRYVAGLIIGLMLMTITGCKISGSITKNGMGMGGVTVVLSGGMDMTTITDTSGRYEFVL